MDQGLLISLIFCITMTLCSQGQNVDVFLPLSLEPGTIVGDLDTLTHPELMQIQNSPYTLLQTGDSDKVSITATLLTLFSGPISESVYIISISHLSGNLTLTLHFILNQDLYIPTITPDVVYLSIPETVVLGYTVHTFECFNSNLDLSHVMQVEFYLSEMIGLFNISIGGELQVSKELNVLDTPFVPVLISCRDPRAPFFEAHVAVAINITHATPTLLTCDTPLTISLCEQLSDVMLSDIKCYHPVYQYPSQLTYVMSDTRFEEQYGQILLTSELDYETSTRIDFQITVSDPLDLLLSSVIDVTVHVLPVNEFMPVFSNTEYHVSENQSPFPQFSLEASDQDHGLHGQFIFQFDTINSKLHTHFIPCLIHILFLDNLPITLSEDGEISVTGILNHEGTSDYTFSIKLTDKLDPDGMTCEGSILTNTQSIQIVVDDVNEQASFVNAPYSFEVLETAPFGTFIGNVECSDPDQNFVDNGRIRYSVASAGSLISIGFTSGSVTLQFPLDFTVSAGSTINIGCQDLGVPPLQDTSEVFISVKPVIEFNQITYTADLPENSGVGTFIETVSLSAQSLVSHNFISLLFSVIADPTAGVIVIDSAIGVLTLNQPVPFGINNNEYVLTVKATAEVRSNDGTLSETITTAQLIISIVNDTYLYFPSTYSANVSENVRDISLLTVMAINNVTNSSDDILYTLSGLSSDFEVNNLTGELLLISPLDRETQSMYTIVIIAYDMFNTSISARTFVTVRVLDLNDVTPICVSLTEIHITGHYFAVPQILTPLLNCTDLDAESPNNNITYSLVDYNFPNISIDSTTGRISGMGDLTLGLHDLIVLVLDRGLDPGPLNTTEIVRLQVTRNDFNPQFINITPSIDLFENHTLTPIITIYVSDEDIGPPADILFRHKVISPEDDDVFAINATTGVLSLIASLDYERSREYVIELNATDNGRPRRSNTTILILRVINLNDESPYCGVLPSIQLDFDNHFPDFLFQLYCVDPDNFADLLFYSINTSNASSYFSISNEGIIQTISSFVPLSSPVFPVALPIPILIGENDSDLTSLVYLNVLLGESGYGFDFLPSPPLSLPENSPIDTPVATFVASANPTQTNLLIRYSIRSITPDNVFEIDVISGEVTLSQNIDYEDVAEYNISIRGVDNATYVNIRILYATISIIDICDNAPLVNHTQSSIIIPQGTGVNVIHAFSCSDRDAGNNGEIFCSVNSIEPLIDGGDPLFVMSGCDLMLNRILNGICELEYNLQISCSDLCDDISLRTNLSFGFQVNIIIEDLERPTLIQLTNANVPYPANIFVKENQTVPFEIDVANNHFIDGDCGPFNETFFRIIHSPPGYMISDIYEGRIVLNSTVDFDKDTVLISESHRIHSVLTVYDCEELLPSCQGETDMSFIYIVQVVDVNDNRPYCNSTTAQLRIPETAALNETYTTSVICYDMDRSADTFGMLSFEIDPNNSLANETFQVFSSFHSSVDNARRLNIRLRSPLDYENTTQYVVLIRVYDGGDPPLYSDDVITLTVDVASVNEHLPFFENELEKLSLREDFNISNIIHTSTVMDLDHAPDNKALYQLSVNPYGKFLINISNGEITLVSSLDREQMDFYRLVVLATEDTVEPHNHTATQTIEIEITDVNDNSPQLDLPAVPIQIQQNVSIGEIHSFSCTDADIDVNGIFRCDVTSPVFDNINLFTLSVISPVCRLSIESNPVPNCNVSLMHDLNINCTDSGDPSLNSSFSVSVVVNLVNLQDPVVSNSLAPIPVSESTPVPTPLVDISQFVSDGDCQNFSEVRFFINNQYPSIPAYLSLSQMGEIQLINELDFDTTFFGSPPSLQLEVVARDNPGALTSREVIFNVTFLIQDSNDNPPTCTDLSVTVSIEEGSISTHNLSTVCNDIDSALNGELDPTFASDHDSLFIFSSIAYNSSHSLISVTLVDALDFETTESFTVVVLVSDQGIPQMNITISVTILVVNINDNTPFFTNPPVSLTIVENDPPAILPFISADDDDKGIFGQLIYLLITARYDNLSTPIDISTGNTSQFEVGLYSGELIQLTSIDFEIDVTFLFAILAQDLGSPARSVKAYFNITIENVNEFAPQIILPSPGSILQGTPVNTVIEFVSVTDEDRGDTFSCFIRTDSIPSPIAASLFNLSSIAERVYIILAQPVVCNDQLLYQLNIVCTDNVVSPLSSLAVFNISILSQNLNVPVPSMHALSFDINENEALSTVITDISSLLFDPDCAMNGSYSYSIFLQNPINHNYLAIDALSGEVFINETIDYESVLFISTIPMVEIRIQVHDDLLTGSTPLSSPIILVAKITDLNDNPHVCIPNDTISVPEAMSFNISTGIICTDSDTFTNITAELTEPSSEFSVEMVRTMDTTYRLILKVNNLDYEVDETHTLLVLISDPTNPDFNQTVTLYIQVLSVNEFTPFLLQSSRQIPENSDVGLILADLRFAVFFTEGNESLIFSIISQQYPYPVELDPNTGILTLNTSLDHENPDHRETILQIIVTDTGIPPLTSPAATFTLTVTDLNDNPVTIDYLNNQTYFEIFQSQSSGIVANFSCTDPDFSFANMLFTCSLDPASNPMNFGTDVFMLSYSQSVCAILAIQFPPCVNPFVYNLTVNCENINDLNLTRSFDFQVHLIPENLVPPSTSKQVFPIFEDSVSELDTTNFPIVIPLTSDISNSFSDSDCGLFGQILYRVDRDQSNNLEYVSVNNRTGEVTIIREVDKEVLKLQTGSQRINIILDVVDNDGESGFMIYNGNATHLITIDIQDDNDEPPSCDVTSLSLTLQEENPNSVFKIPGGQFICMDNDSCPVPGGEITASAATPFGVIAESSKCVNVTKLYEPTVFEVFSFPIDLETLRETVQEFVVSVTDGVNSISIPVTVTILDLPEFPIEFSQPSYDLIINYTAPVGPVDFFVTATDLDFTSQIRYTSDNQIFSVDYLSGIISIEPDFSLTENTTFQVVITATELTTADTTAADLHIIVNHPPTISKPSTTEYCVDDDTPFLSLNYSDNNLNTPGQDEVKFYFLNLSNPPLSNITTNSTIEFAAINASSFSTTAPSEYTIIIEDSTGYTDSFSFNVTQCSITRRRRLLSTGTRYKRDIIKSLHFTKLATLVYVPISFSPGSTLPVQFCKSELTLPITYSLLLANHSEWPFAIGPVSAEIQVSNSLYHLTYPLVMECMNSLHEQIASYTVIALKQNEYIPIFNESTGYKFSVKESSPINTVVGVVLAETPRMHTMSYHVTTVAFDAIQYTGGIKLTSILDYEIRTSYSFIVTAINVDIHSIQPSAMTSVTVSVTDVNDNAPVSVGDLTLVIYISPQQDLPIGQVFEQVFCTDADLPETNQIEYSLETPHLIFDATPIEGYIYLTSNAQLLTLEYTNVFITRCTDQSHLPNPAFDRSVVTVSTRLHSSVTCPQVSSYNLTWPETEPNITARVLCPETLKVASRVCSWAAEWQYPDMSECNTLHNIPTPIIPVVPETDCFSSFIALYQSNILLIKNNLADTSTDKLHLAGDLRLSVEYFLTADGLLTCLPLNITAMHQVAVSILEGLDLLTQSHFSDAWLTSGPYFQRIVSRQLVYILNSLSHKLMSPYANSTQIILSNYYQFIANELHPNQMSTIHGPYLFTDTLIAFTSCYLQAIPQELGLSYLNDTTVYILHNLLPHESSDGVLRRGVSTSYVGVYSSGYIDNGPGCTFNITFTTKQGTEDHICAVWEFTSSDEGHWNADICLTYLGETDVVCSCRGVGVVGVIGTTPPIVYPDCFPLADLVAFILFLLSSITISLCITISMVLLISFSRKEFKKPSLYFKLHTLSFLLLAEIVNFIGIFVIPYDDVCEIIAILTHILFVFVFCWILILSFFHLLQFLFPKREEFLNKFSLALFFMGYAIPLCLVIISLIDYAVYGIRAPPNTSQCKYLYCWISSAIFPTYQLISSALPLICAQIVLATPLFLHFFISNSDTKTKKLKPYTVSTKLQLSHVYSETIPGYAQVFLLGFHYAFLSNAYEGLTFGILSFLFTLLTSVFLLCYYTGFISFLTKKSATRFLRPKHSAHNFISAEDYETRLVSRQHERVNWAFLNAQEERFYEEGRQLGAHFKIATPLTNTLSLLPD